MPVFETGHNSIFQRSYPMFQTIYCLNDVQFISRWIKPNGNGFFATTYLAQASACASIWLSQFLFCYSIL